MQCRLRQSTQRSALLAIIRFITATRAAPCMKLNKILALMNTSEVCQLSAPDKEAPMGPWSLSDVKAWSLNF